MPGLWRPRNGKPVDDNRLETIFYVLIIIILVALAANWLWGKYG